MSKAWALAGVVGAGYAWWAAGLAPFGTASYLAIALPAGGLTLLYAVRGGLAAGRAAARRYRRVAAGATPRSAAPWAALLAGVLALESAGLALGGRSGSLPTLSTELDRLLDGRPARAAVLLAWLLLGALASARPEPQGREGEG